MAKGVNKLLAVALAGAGLYGAWTLGSSLLGSDDAESESTRHVVNQVWIERMPASQRDVVGHLVVIDHPEGRIGAAGRSSQWRHLVELFAWKLEGQRLNLYFPQDEVHAAVAVKTYECEGEAPAPFQLCMDISNGRSSVTYYSRRDWKIEPQQAADSIADIVEETPLLRGVLATIGEAPSDLGDLELDDYTDVERLPIAD